MPEKQIMLTKKQSEQVKKQLEQPVGLYEEDNRWDFLQVTVKLDTGRKYQGDMREELEIDPSQINQELQEQPAKFAWWATIHSLSQARVDDLKRRMDLREAELSKEFREAAIEDGTKLTEKSIEHAITRDLEYQEMAQALVNAKRDAGIFQVARDAFKQRADAMVTLSTNLRHQLDVDLAQKTEAYEKAARERGRR